MESLADEGSKEKMADVEIEEMTESKDQMDSGVIEDTQEHQDSMGLQETWVWRESPVDAVRMVLRVLREPKDLKGHQALPVMLVRRDLSDPPENLVVRDQEDLLVLTDYRVTQAHPAHQAILDTQENMFYHRLRSPELPTKDHHT